MFVGAGMGTSVGVLQARVLRGLVARPAAGFWSCAGGLAAPFLAVDVVNAAGLTASYPVYAAVAAADGRRLSRSLRGLAGALAYLGIIAVGGLPVGLTTGAAFGRMRGRTSEEGARS